MENGEIKKDVVGIISLQSSCSSKIDERVERFVQEVKNFGLQPKILFFDKFFINFNDETFNIFYEEKKLNLKKFRAFIPTINTHKNLDTNTFFIYVIEKLGGETVNNRAAILRAKNKVKSGFILANAGLPIIPTAISFSEVGLKPLFNFIKGDEFICKLNYGSVGRGVSYINSRISLISTFELLKAEDIQPSKVMFQKFLKEAKGKDIRIFVVGNKAIAAIERSANGIDFRANLFSGGNAKTINPSEKIKKMAIKATKALGLDYSGVDVIMSKSGPRIVEVNPNPGLKIEQVTGKNVTREIIKHILKKYPN